MSNIRQSTNENSNLPVMIFLNKVKKISSNIQKNVEFLFVLKGELEVIINNQKIQVVRIRCDINK